MVITAAWSSRKAADIRHAVRIFPRLSRKPCVSSAWGRLNANLSTVWIAQAHPGIANLLVMHHGAVDLDVETKPLRRQCTDRREQGIRSDHAVVLGGDQRNARIHQLLLGVEHVERGPLSNTRFLAHTV